MINSKEDLVNKIKEMARDLENRAEDIAVDWNKKIKRISFYFNIDPTEITKWDITKEYLVLPKRIDMQLEYNKDKVDKMKAMGFDKITIPAKLTIESKEYYCSCVFSKNKMQIELNDEILNLNEIKNIFNSNNEFYYLDEQYYLGNWEGEIYRDNEIFVKKVSFIQY